MRIKNDRYLGFLSNSIIQLVCIIWALGQVFPLFWLFYSTFKTSSEIRNNILAFPTHLYLQNYNIKLIASGKDIRIDLYLTNSIIITIVSLILLTAIALFAGYAIAKLEVPGKNIIIMLLITLLGVPMHSVVIPLYYFISKMNLLNNYFGLILPYVGFNLPFSILLLQTFFRQFPDELIDAAKIDGCSNSRTFLSIVLPISRGGISAVLIINFIGIWNEFLLALVIMKANHARTLPVGLMAFKEQYYTDWGRLYAALMIAIIPPIIFYFVFHRNILKGLTSGAIKG